jgi:hypothetical protein
MSSFQNQKNLIGLPKIALRKSGTEMLKKFAGCGGIKFFSRSVRFLANFWAALIFASLYQDKEGRKKKIIEYSTSSDLVCETYGFYTCDFGEAV